MKKAFTLVELLVVVGIMGLLGTVSVGGYRAMQRGMEERGVMQNVNAFVKLAYERAQIDRKPTAVYFWNETLREETMDVNEIVVGRAVAIRCQGRLSKVENGGERLIDEFADLDQTFITDKESGSNNGASDNTRYLYCLDNLNEIKRSVIYDKVFATNVREVYLNGEPVDSVGNGEMELWAFRVKSNTDGPTWQTGSVYGMEFAEITLPHGYIFGSTYSKTISNPVSKGSSMSFKPGQVSGENGSQGADVYGSMTVYSLRQSNSGLTAQSVDTVENPK